MVSEQGGLSTAEPDLHRVSGETEWDHVHQLMDAPQVIVVAFGGCEHIDAEVTQRSVSRKVLEFDAASVERGEASARRLDTYDISLSQVVVSSGAQNVAVARDWRSASSWWRRYAAKSIGGSTRKRAPWTSRIFGPPFA